MKYFLLTDEGTTEITAAEAKGLLDSGSATLWHTQQGETYLKAVTNEQD